MNIASLELCKELHELSGWGDEYWWHKGADVNSSGYVSDWDEDNFFYGLIVCPAYSLGSLQRRIPQGYVIFKGSSCMYRSGKVNYDHDNEQLVIEPNYWEQFNDAENAAAKLLIELHKQGVLVKEQS